MRVSWQLVTEIILILIITLFAWALVYAEDINYTDEEIVNAIFKAEGGYKTTYLYGIVSVPYSNEAEARRVCFNTVRNNRARFAKQTKHKDYLDFLASRYCPVGDNDLGTNKYWLKNVRYFLAKGNERG